MMTGARRAVRQESIVAGSHSLTHFHYTSTVTDDITAIKSLFIYYSASRLLSLLFRL